MNKLASSMASKISHLALVDPNSAQLLYDAVKNSGYSESARQIINASIDSKFEQQLDAEPEVKASKRQQLLIKPLVYVTAAFMAVLTNPRSTIDYKIQACADFMSNKLGIYSPHERTYRYWLCLVLMSHFKNWPRYKLIHNYLVELKQALKNVRKKWPLPLVSEFPDNPHALPEAIYKQMYGDTPPIVATMEHFEVTARCHIPLRKNSKLITMEKAALAAKAEQPDHASAGVKEDPAGNVNLNPVKSEEEAPAWAQKILQRQAILEQKLNRAPPVKLEAQSFVEPMTMAQPVESAEDVPAWAQRIIAKQEQLESDMNKQTAPVTQGVQPPKGLRPRLYMRTGMNAHTATAGEDSAADPGTTPAPAGDTSETGQPGKSGRALEEKFVHLHTAKKTDPKKRPAAADGAGKKGKATKVKAEVAVTAGSKGKPKMPTLKAVSYTHLTLPTTPYV